VQELLWFFVCCSAVLYWFGFPVILQTGSSNTVFTTALVAILVNAEVNGK
jgi:hypothetical protein